MGVEDMMFPKQSWKKTKRKRNWKNAPKKVKVRSIMQDDKDKRCFLCMMLDGNYQEYGYTEEHHVLYGSRHELSDKYGLRVRLCLNHHRTANESLHSNQEIADLLKAEAQKRFMEVYPDLDWMDIVGKNYL